MKKSAITLFAFALLSLTACKNEQKSTSTDPIETTETSADAAKFNVDVEASKISWEGAKVFGGKHHGTVSLVNGEINEKDGKIENGSFVIDMTTINVEDLASGDGKEDLEAHLKGTGKEEASDHFFNVTKYPEAKFDIASVKEVDGKTIVAGNLTLKGITKAIEFPAMIHNSENEIMIHADAFPINRTDFKVNYNSNSIFDNLGDKAIKDQIELKLHIVAKK